MDDKLSAKALSLGTILLVDDDVEATSAASELLAREGYRVVRAADGRRALKLLDAGDHPDLIVCDLQMPVMSGWEFVEALRKRVDLGRIPVVSWSGSDFHADHVGDAFLRKPINPSKLLRVIRDRLKRGEAVPEADKM